MEAAVVEPEPEAAPEIHALLADNAARPAFDSAGITGTIPDLTNSAAQVTAEASVAIADPIAVATAPARPRTR